MNRNSWLVAGFALLLGLSGCSDKIEKITSVGSYAPVITGLHMSREPAVRGVENEVTLLVTNVNGIPLAYHWRAGAGVLLDSTVATVTWEAPDSIGIYEMYVSVEGTDVNEMYYFREKTFSLYVDNDYERWTGGETIKFDVSPPGNQEPDPTHPVLYAEFENATTGESRVVAISSPLGVTTPISDGFFAAASPTLQADGSQIAFAGRARSSAPAPSIYLIPATGAQTDTTNAIPVARYRPTGPDRTLLLGNPRFARGGAMLAYNSDSITLISSSGSPHLYVRDAANFSVAPQALITTGGSELGNTYWAPSWNGAGDSVLCESYSFWNTILETTRGIFRLRAAPTFQSTGGTAWLPGGDLKEVDWSPDGQYVAFTRKNPAGDRDIWIINSGATSQAQAVRVTLGPADDAHPRFSSDGTKIWFVSNRADRYGLNGLFGTERRGYNVWTVRLFDRP